MSGRDCGDAPSRPKTVANTRYLIKDKLDVRSDIELVWLSLRQGLLTLPQIEPRET